MIKKFLLRHLAALIILTTLLFVHPNVTEADPSTNTPQQQTQGTPFIAPENSVLHLVPEKTLGFIYCPNLIELDNRINTLRTELLPETPDAPTGTLSDSFESLFKSLTGLEDIGVDLSQDFAILLTRLKPPQLALLAHLTDPEPMRQMMEARMEAGDRAASKDVTYWNDTENNRHFVLLERTLIVSKQREVCENIIDTYNGKIKAAIKHPDHASFFTDISEDGDQFAVYFDVDTALATLDRPLEEELEAIIDDLEGTDDLEGIDALEGIFKSGLPFIKQLRSGNVRFQVEGTDVYVKPFLKFRSDSEYLELLKEASDELVFLDELPKRAFMNAAFQGSPRFLTETSNLWFSFFPGETPEQRAQRDELLEQTKGFYESLADRWSFSFNLRNTSLPVFIYELKDEQRAKVYMDEVFLEKLDATGAYLGKSIMHNRVEIKSYVFPNFKEDLPEETADLVSPEWHWYYAFTDGQLLFTTGTSPESMQMVLNRKAGSEEKFADHESYQKLVDSLGTDNNVLLAISPVLLFKNLLGRDIDVDDTAPMQLFASIFMTLPENYSVGLSAKARGNGIDANLFINLADFKQLGQMFQMMAQMIQMP